MYVGCRIGASVEGQDALLRGSRGGTDQTEVPVGSGEGLQCHYLTPGAGKGSSVSAVVN